MQSYKQKLPDLAKNLFGHETHLLEGHPCQNSQVIKFKKTLSANCR